MTHGKTYNKSPRRINYKATRSKTNLRQNLVLYLLICSNNLLIRVKFPRNGLWLTSVHFIRKKGKRKVQGVLQSQTAALPRPQEEEEKSTELYHRPVSLTCVPCKMLEHIVCTNIIAHLDEHKLLSDRQHAFRKNRSCETQLITVINDWAKNLDAGG